MVGLVNISPEAVLLAASELDLLADRLGVAATFVAPATHVAPSGTEEVSFLAAHHLNHAAVTHDAALANAQIQLHHAATVLRMQLATHIGEDTVRSTVINGVAGTIGA